MPDIDDQPCCRASHALRLAAASHWSLTVLGVVLLIWGVGPYIASFLYFLAQVMSWPLEPFGARELLVSVVLLALIPMKVVRRISTATRWTIVGIGFFAYAAWYWRLVAWTLEIRFLHHITRRLGSELDDRAIIGLMIATLGLILICSNGWGLRILQRLRKTGVEAASCSRTHAKAVVMATLIGFWLMNPYHSYEVCIQASRVAENHGAYRTAIIFTELARDTFPEPITCGNYWMYHWRQLSTRIGYLKCKRDGLDVDPKPSGGNRAGEKLSQAPSWGPIISPER
jgi:hypothetical protein